MAAREVLRRLLRSGFIVKTIKGSHYKLFNPRTGRITEVALHPGDLGRGILTKIIKQAGLTVKEFLDL
jgi:predicted RNA binding protein YcfA (HicA-like mRNA interferase family)